jgi:hypothetical protein
MNGILSDIGSHTHILDANGDRKPCYSACTDQVSGSKSGQWHIGKGRLI